MHRNPLMWPQQRAYPEKLVLMLLLLVVLVLAGCAASSSSTSYNRVIYAGVSANVSQLEPDTSGSSIFSLDESQSGGAGLILGYDLSERLAAELRYTDLGSASLAPVADITYQALGTSLLYYPFGDARSPGIGTGFTGFVRGGVNLMMHDSDIQLDAEDNFQVVAGLGIDYLFSDRLSVRAEVDYHDVDANALHLGLIYRFGSQPDGGPQYVGQRPVARPQPQQPTFNRPTQPQPAPLPDIAPLPQSQQPQVVERPVQQQPQVVQPPVRQPLPPTTPQRQPTLDTRLVDGEINGVNFAAGSARLDDRAFTVLDSLAAELRQRPSARIELQVHTNGAPGSRPALNLSRARALVVGRLLLSRGVNQSQLSARAFGANQPRVGAGQVANERIELRIISF